MEVQEEEGLHFSQLHHLKLTQEVLEMYQQFYLHKATMEAAGIGQVLVVCRALAAVAVVEVLLDLVVQKVLVEMIGEVMVAQDVKALSQVPCSGMQEGGAVFLDTGLWTMESPD